MQNLKSFLSVILSLSLLAFHPGNLAYAADGDDAVFSFEPLNGKQGENEVKLVVNTDNAAINHLIFDIKDAGDQWFFDMDAVNDPVNFPLNGQSVLGTSTGFTSTSGDIGYDLASANPANVGTYTNLHFATLIADENRSNGPGGLLEFDVDTAIYVNAQRRGLIDDTYTVLPNVAPSIDIVVNPPKVDGVNLEDSIFPPSAENPVPATLIQDVSVTPNFTFNAVDSTDASVQRQMKVYKRLDDGSWNYPSSATKTVSYNRSGSNMSFSSTLSGGSSLDFSSYYKVEFTVTDDQGAMNTEVFYFSTSSDNFAPTKVGKASMSFLNDSDDRTDVISQISFTKSSDNSSVSDYYLWTKEYLEQKNIINSDATRNLALDFNDDETVSDEEFYNSLRVLVDEGLYVSTISAGAAGNTPYFRVTGSDVDKVDNNNTPEDANDDLYLVPNSLAEDILYVVAADDATTIDGFYLPNFSTFEVVEKFGDVFGAEIELNVQGATYSYLVGDGSLDVWDAVHTYRNIIGRTDEFPILRPDFVHSSEFNYPSNLSTSAATLVD